ncbi:MAG: hypothetical protein F7B18_04070 [Desulfurococcales archaeon]|nr:hypothetical protein [Desulfurococcales archaeon]
MDNTSNSKVVLSTILYYIITYAYIYITSFFIIKYFPNLISNPAVTIATIIGAIAIFLVVAYLTYTLILGCDESGFLQSLGLTTRNLLESLSFSSSSIAIPAIALGIIAYIGGADPVRMIFEDVVRYLENAPPPWFSEVPNHILPLASIAVWSLVGIVWFAFLQVFPLNLLSRVAGPASVLVVSLLFILIYGAPLLTGDWKPDDIVILGVLFPIVLYRYRNSLGAVMSYVLLYEMPVRAAFLQGWGFTALKILVALQALWGLISIIITLQIISRGNRLG